MVGEEEGSQHVCDTWTDTYDTCTNARMIHVQTHVVVSQQLLNYEPRAEEQVPLLITLHEDELALVKAVESGDTDLSMSILRHTHTLRTFLPIRKELRA